ncbi:hypothetical protein CK203_039126 [Vitis vinifera]|uniref:Uncharacterized protein n=1 Tax=Vitis vinifera TaxID=29760 RepID=A0A438IFM6_VITVI|nr:hypothetical protein CK203_039126 [Vitis vinifera]
MERWCEDEPLGEAFPILLSIASTKDTWYLRCGSSLERVDIGILGVPYKLDLESFDLGEGDKETIDPTLLHGSKTIMLWHLIYALFVIWIMHSTMRTALLEEAEIELGTDSKCALKDEGEKLKVKVLVKWSRKDWLA